MGDKRPLEGVEIGENVAKRAKLNDLKSQLETLMKTAAEKHENIRIDAVDKAYDLEVKLRETKEKHQTKQKELDEVSTQLEDATSSLETFQQSDTMKMLKAANECTLTNVQPLVKEYQAINDILEQLVNMEKTLIARRDELQQNVTDLNEKANDLQTKYDTAESHVTTITELNEL
jgi:chromosome segregation ATPase